MQATTSLFDICLRESDHTHTVEACDRLVIGEIYQEKFSAIYTMLINY